MTTESTNRQILDCAAAGAAPEDIAEELGVNIELVNLVLSANGYGGRDINDAQLAILRHNAMDLALQRENLPVAAKMTEFLIERDKPRQTGGQNPILIINAAIQSAQARFQELAAEYDDKIVNLS